MLFLHAALTDWLVDISETLCTARYDLKFSILFSLFQVSRELKISCDAILLIGFQVLMLVV